MKQVSDLAKDTPPPDNILIPIGQYNGIDLPDTFIDKNYTVWLEMPNPERNCQAG